MMPLESSVSNATIWSITLKFSITLLQASFTLIYVEGVTLVLPSCFSCLTNVRENISYKIEYQLCETRSIRTSTSITLKKKDELSSPLLLSIKVT
jgi:hypothetical protein